jgi:activator of HSP90 ATPase
VKNPPTTFRQTVTFRASPHEIYEALMDSKKHARFTGAAARISRKVGGTLSAHAGYIQGSNLELIPDKKIVQAWRGSDWKPGEESTVVFELKAAGKGTRLNFTHRNVPGRHVESVKQGWKTYYWIPLKKMLEE